MIVEAIGEHATRWIDPRERARLALPAWWINHEVAEVSFSETDWAIVDLDDQRVEPVGVFLLEGANGFMIGRCDADARGFDLVIPVEQRGIRVELNQGTVRGRVKSMWSMAGL